MIQCMKGFREVWGYVCHTLFSFQITINFTCKGWGGGNGAGSGCWRGGKGCVMYAEVITPQMMVITAGSEESRIGTTCSSNNGGHYLDSFAAQGTIIFTTCSHHRKGKTGGLVVGLAIVH